MVCGYLIEKPSIKLSPEFNDQPPTLLLFHFTFLFPFIFDKLLFKDVFIPIQV